jgi:UDP-N-acetylglucosamine 2-epimerase (non-hydrolysing)
MKILCVFGTRPEAIKLAPVVKAIAAARDLESLVCVTGQHREMLRQALALFDIRVDRDLDVMRDAQGLAETTSSILNGLDGVLDELRPDRVIVQGDTSTTFSASLAAYDHQIPVAHVEAGLRTGDLYAPWPEEGNRKLTSALADLHFAPTEGSRRALERESVPAESIVVTGNTVIDALLDVVGRMEADPAFVAPVLERFAHLDAGRRLILVTGHRRENFDGGLVRVCEALRQLANRGDVEIVYAVHLNPNVQSAVQQTLTDHPSIHLIEPQEYLPFVYLMQRASLIITDSGGVQEEAPSLGKPVLVTREKTERPEAVEAGTVLLVGTDREKIVKEAERLLDDETAYRSMSIAHNPYGDGQASQRIVRELERRVIF